MCRLLAVVSDEPCDPSDLVRAFAERCRASEEYQGHGWGFACASPFGWERYRSLRPIWEDEIAPRPPSRLWIVHARSAFRDEGIVLPNNMPFLRGDLAFAFNGELHGVRLSVPGETGAARLLELLARFRESCDGDIGRALARLDSVTAARSEYVRALNVVAASPDRLVAHCRYGEAPEYFTLHRATAELPAAGSPSNGDGGVAGPGVRSHRSAAVLCSEALGSPLVTTPWTAFANGETRELCPEAPC